MASSVVGLPQRASIYDSPADRDWSAIKLAAFVLILGTAFWLVDHDFFASQRYLFADEIFEVENYTADAIEQAGTFSAPARLLMGGLGMLLLLWPAKREVQLVNLLSVALLVLFVFLLVSVVWSANPRVTLQKCMSLTLLLLIATGVAKQCTLHELTRILPMICVSFIGFGFVVELGLGTFKPWQNQYRFVGTTHPNTQAVYATVCCLAATTFRKSAGASKFWPILFASVGIATLLLTKSRTTMLALLLGVSSLGFLQLRGVQRMFVVSVILMGVSVFGMLLCLQSTSTLDSLAESLAMGRTENVANLTGRLPLWEELSRWIAKRPVVGYGYLAFWDSARVQYLSDTLGWEIPHGHNMYIDVLLDGGFVGLMLFLGFYLASMITIVDRYQIYGDAAVAFVFGMLVFALVHGIGESLFKLPTFLLFLLLVFSMRVGFLPRLRNGEGASGKLNLRQGKVSGKTSNQVAGN